MSSNDDFFIETVRMQAKLIILQAMYFIYVYLTILIVYFYSMYINDFNKTNIYINIIRFIFLRVSITQQYCF